MITQNTAERIWDCYREISASEKLLVDLDNAKKEDRHDPHAETLRDAFGRRRNLQLGVPFGENGHRLFDVSPKLARSVIVAHIAEKWAELAEANEQARIELGNSSVGHDIPFCPSDEERKRALQVERLMAACQALCETIGENGEVNFRTAERTLIEVRSMAEAALDFLKPDTE